MTGLFLFDFTEPADVVEPKVYLATAVVALALLQVATMAVVYGWLPVLEGRRGALSRFHRWEGRLVFVGVIVTAILCIVAWGPSTEDARRTVHSIVGIAVVALLPLKLAAVRFQSRVGRALPYLGIALAAVLVVQWSTSALWYWTTESTEYRGDQAPSAVVEIVDAAGVPGAFSPAALTVAIGDVVQWRHRSDLPHTVSGKGFTSGPSGFDRGETFQAKFDTAGTFAYVCDFHPGAMKGTITVR